jgi:hypothetical protein
LLTGRRGFRSALPAWIPLLCAAEQFTDPQRALLMSAFFPGYILTQIPGSFAIQCDLQSSSGSKMFLYKQHIEQVEN